jgi:type IV pilus assembly protein PilC
MKKKKSLNQLELSAFCQQIAMIIEAGLPTYYGISILRDDAPDEETKALLSKIYEPMESGGSLHDALKGVHGSHDRPRRADRASGRGFKIPDRLL